jgi:glutamate 5-kinase
LKDYKRIVVKIGSSLFSSASKGVELVSIGKFSSQILSLIESGKEIVVVSSGAIALGMHKLKAKERPRGLSDLAAYAAVGQNELMNAYSRFLGDKVIAAQILLTWEDFNDRTRYLNAKNTIEALLKLGNVVPIINENDSISTEEIRFGDNDTLSARVASLIGADILIILSDVDGLLDKDKKTVIRVVAEITPQIKALATPTHKKTCVGGMITKLEAASISTSSGLSCVIANGHKKDIILSVVKDPGSFGTLFVPKEGLTAKLRWIAFGTKSKGRINIDEGAKVALLNNKSLLSVGVVSVEGNFEHGEIVTVTSNNLEIARGKAGISAKELNKVKGLRCDKEVIHRDNMVNLLRGEK